MLLFVRSVTCPLYHCLSSSNFPLTLAPTTRSCTGNEAELKQRFNSVDQAASSPVSANPSEAPAVLSDSPAASPAMSSVAATAVKPLPSAAFGQPPSPSAASTATNGRKCPPLQLRYLEVIFVP